MSRKIESAIVSGYEKRQKKYRWMIGLLVVIVLALAAFMMMYGTKFYTPDVIFRVLLGEEIKGAVFPIKTLRLPRMLTALFCGWAFGLAGNTFQKLLGNPLASPDIIGITSGASVAAVFGILFLNLNRGVVSILAVLTGMLVSFLIFMLSRKEGFVSGRLILTGIGVQSFLSALISWMLLKASEYDVAGALRWLSGSLNGVTMESILVLAALFLIAFATSVTGPIASVAFLAGPIAGKLLGGGRNNLIASALVGQILVLASDMLGQYGFQARYPVGVVTGILGAPYLLFLLITMNRKGEQS